MFYPKKLQNEFGVRFLIKEANMRKEAFDPATGAYWAAKLFTGACGSMAIRRLLNRCNSKYFNRIVSRNNTAARGRFLMNGAAQRANSNYKNIKFLRRLGINENSPGFQEHVRNLHKYENMYDKGKAVMDHAGGMSKVEKYVTPPAYLENRPPKNFLEKMERVGTNLPPSIQASNMTFSGYDWIKRIAHIFGY